MNRRTYLWEQLWLSQDKKCAECGCQVAIEDTASPGHSFKILCQTCYDKPKSITHIILDEYANC